MADIWRVTVRAKKIVAGIIGSLAIAAVAGGCGASSNASTTTKPETVTTPTIQTPTSQTPTSSAGATTTTASTPTAEYLAIVGPVDTTRAAFEAGRSDPTLRAAAGPFGEALTNWSAGLSSYPNWPSAAKTAVSNVVADVPPYVVGLEAFASSSISFAQFTTTYGGDGVKLAAASEALRSTLGLAAAG
jgi:hypothetical protein